MIDADIDSVTFTERLLSEAHVSIAPGDAYGSGGEGYVRISLGVPDDRLDEALHRMSVWYSEKH
ncbi:MAG: LL-diaminopimelate aminotransferase, partial [Chloroflexota bacterium]